MSVGECGPLQLKIWGLDPVFTVRPLVVEGLSRDMNVGRDFLGRNKCILAFHARGGELQVGAKLRPSYPANQGPPQEE